MSYLLKSGETEVTFEGGLDKTSAQGLTLYSRFLNAGEAKAMLTANAEGRLKEHLHALKKHEFLALLIDGTHHSVALINDKFGSNHLFYAIRNGVLWASDDVARLYSEWHEEPRVNAAAAYELLEFYTICPPRTIFEGLLAVPMGSVLRFAPESGAAIERYWDVAKILSSKINNYDEFVRVFTDAFVGSLKQEYEKGKTGIALSGGIDSGGMLAVLTDIAREPLPSISFGPHGKESGDLISARETAKEMNSPQAFLYPSLADIARLPEMVKGLNQPFTFDVLYPNTRLFEQAKAMGLKKLGFGYGSEMLLGNLAMAKYADQLQRFERLVPRPIARVVYRAYARYKKLSRNQLEFMLSDSWSQRFLQVRGPLFSRNKIVYKRLPKDFLSRFTPELDAFTKESPLGDAVVRMYLSTWENYLQWHDVGALGRRFGIQCIMPFDTPEVAETLFKSPMKFRRLLGWDKKAIRDMFKPFITDRLYHAKGKSLVIPYTKLLAPVQKEIIAYLETSPLIAELVDMPLYKERYETLPEPGLHLARLFGLAVWYDVNWNKGNLPNVEKVMAALRSNA